MVNKWKVFETSFFLLVLHCITLLAPLWALLCSALVSTLDLISGVGVGSHVLFYFFHVLWTYTVIHQKHFQHCIYQYLPLPI